MSSEVGLEMLQKGSLVIMNDGSPSKVELTLFQTSRAGEVVQKMRSCCARMGLALNIQTMAAPGQRQLKALPQLMFRSVLVPILESVQM
eukprot:3542689-Karenia_brevis.AAC.1